MDRLGKSIAGITTDAEPVGVHHSHFFKDYLTHAAVVEKDQQSKHTYANTSLKPVYHYKANTDNDTKDNRISTFSEKSFNNNHYKYQTNANTCQYPSYIRPISNMILTQTTQTPKAQTNPLVIDGRRQRSPSSQISISPQRPTTTHLTHTAQIPSRTTTVTQIRPPNPNPHTHTRSPPSHRTHTHTCHIAQTRHARSYTHTLDIAAVDCAVSPPAVDG